MEPPELVMKFLTVLGEPLIVGSFACPHPPTLPNPHSLKSFEATFQEITLKVKIKFTSKNKKPLKWPFSAGYTMYSWRVFLDSPKEIKITF